MKFIFRSSGSIKRLKTRTSSCSNCHQLAECATFFDNIKFICILMFNTRTHNYNLLNTYCDNKTTKCTNCCHACFWYLRATEGSTKKSYTWEKGRRSWCHFWCYNWMKVEATLSGVLTWVWYKTEVHLDRYNSVALRYLSHCILSNHPPKWKTIKT